MAGLHLPNGLTDVRSTYLRQVATLQDQGAIRRFWTRLALVVGIGLVLGFFFWLLRSRALPVEVAGLLYAWHDNMLLPFVGYTFTLFFPWSLIWWSVAMVFFAIWLVSYVRNRSVLRPFYYGLCRLVLAEQVYGIPLLPYHSKIADWLVITSHALRHLGLRPILFENIAQREYIKTLHELVTTQEQNARARQAQRLQRIAALRIRLSILSSAALTLDHLHAAVLWSQVMVHTRYFGQSQFLDTFPQLHKLFTGLLQAAPLEAPQGAQTVLKTHFGLAGLGENMVDMAELALPASHPAIHLGSRLRLTDAARARQLFLEEIARRFQYPFRFMPLDGDEKNLVAMQSELLAIPPDQVRSVGRLALTITEFAAKGAQNVQDASASQENHASLTNDLPELAFGAVEAFEALGFTIPFWNVPASSSTAVPTNSILAQLERMLTPTPANANSTEGAVHRQTLANLPEEQDYRICMVLADDWQTRRAQAASAALRADKDSLDQRLRDDALRLIEQQQLMLQLARGPQPRGEM